MSAVLNIFRLLGDLMHLLSILILGYKMKTTRSCSGISIKSQVLYFLVYVTRYLDLFYTLSFDVLHVYNFFMKLFFIGSQGLILYFMTTKYRATYDPRMDSLRVAILLAPAAVLALFMEDLRFAHTFFLVIREYFWTFSILLESVAILPQLFMLQKTGEAEIMTTHYLICLGLYRGLYLLNWLYRYAVGQHPELVAVLAGTLQTALYSDLFYIYYKRVFIGKAFKLPI